MRPVSERHAEELTSPLLRSRWRLAQWSGTAAEEPYVSVPGEHEVEVREHQVRGEIRSRHTA
jgi:hypothetical protein